MTPLELFAQQLANGLTLGAIYALIALGYTMVYGVVQLINFAHGEVFMAGAYAAVFAVLFVGVSGAPWGVALGVAVGAAVILCAALGWAIERLAYRPIRQASRLNAFITAIGMSLFLQNALMLIGGATDRQFPAIVPALRWEVAGVTVTLIQLLVWGSAAAMMAALQWLVMATRLGKAMRATAQDLTACLLLGIPVDRIIAVTFMAGSSLAAVGGVLFGLQYGTINFHDGYLIGMKAFTAAVLGGIGNIPGAMAGGLLLGLIESLAAGYLSAQWKSVFAFGVLVIVLLWRPTGLFGERVADRA
ncbi:MAG: branched-chain amino acid ABC transporter permease [Candidatus Omnitrophica bacterium]|nr:branched-chain amino acid ABC transporter permease [Candidatus Omnitrophota bacterium]